MHYFARTGGRRLSGSWLIFILQFFRDPPRTVPDTPDAVICPADGRMVMRSERRADPYLKRDALQDQRVHERVQRALQPQSGGGRGHGTLVPAGQDSSTPRSTRPRSTTSAMPCGYGPTRRRTWPGVQVAGLIARRILCYVQPGERIARGERYGFIRFGSRVDVYLPPRPAFEVSLGRQSEAAPPTVIARLAP